MTEAMRVELQDRRQQLSTLMARRGDDERLTALLADVDLALARVDAGTYGLCETCHDPIEADRLAADPLVRRCLDHLNASELRTLERDLALAARVQRALLPPPDLEHGGWQIAYEYLPHGPVSGDYCDVVQCPGQGPGPLLVVLGDVSGKGVAASMLMAHLRAMVRSLAGFTQQIDDLLARINQMFCESTLPAHYATLACARLGATGEIEVSNAGHVPPMIVHDGRVATIEDGGLPIGMFCTVTHRVARACLTPGDQLVFVTDGLTEARNADDEEYGIERLLRLLERIGPASSARETVAAAIGDARRFLSRQPWADDVSVLVARRL